LFIIIKHSSILPYFEKYSLSSTSVVFFGIPPIKILLGLYIFFDGFSLGGAFSFG